MVYPHPDTWIWCTTHPPKKLTSHPPNLTHISLIGQLLTKILVTLMDHTSILTHQNFVGLPTHPNTSLVDEPPINPHDIDGHPKSRHVKHWWASHQSTHITLTGPYTYDVDGLPTHLNTLYVDGPYDTNVPFTHPDNYDVDRLTTQSNIRQWRATYPPTQTHTSLTRSWNLKKGEGSSLLCVP